MSLVDRWLSRPPHAALVKTSASPPPLTSQHVATGLRQENPQNSAVFVPLSQKSQTSQLARADKSEATPKAQPSQAEPKLLAPVSWYEHLVPPRLLEIPYDRPSPERRGRVERSGPAFLHFCVICGAWGSFGYGVTRKQSGLWYCGEHRPSGISILAAERKRKR
jgi:hypothetical protein